jgi:hypothetical protein
LARQYSAITARFCSPDYDERESGPVGVTPNYTYVDNNPIIFTDPSGHMAAIVESGYRSPQVEFQILDPQVRKECGFYLSGNRWDLFAGCVQAGRRKKASCVRTCLRSHFRVTEVNGIKVGYYDDASSGLAFTGFATKAAAEAGIALSLGWTPKYHEECYSACGYTLLEYLSTW